MSQQPNWYPLENCRSNGTDQHSWTTTPDGTRYESCYNWKGNGSEGSGDKVGRNSDRTCNYPQEATHAYCVKSERSGNAVGRNSDGSVPTASNTTCPDGFSSSGASCKGPAYGADSHGFSGYSNTRKAQWACNAGEGVTWEAVLTNKPSGKTWWIGDENGGYCTNNKVDIIKYGKCGTYGHVLHSDKDPNRWVCAPLTVNANPFEFAPGSPNALYAQVMQNAKFKLPHCWQNNDNPGGSWGNNRGNCFPTDKGVRCDFPEYHCRWGGEYTFIKEGKKDQIEKVWKENDIFTVKMGSHHFSDIEIENKNFIGSNGNLGPTNKTNKQTGGDITVYFGSSSKDAKHSIDGVLKYE